MLSSKEIRQAFIDFFLSKNHHFIPSSPVVVNDDPTLMFTNAGMNQFKNIFLGKNLPKYPRVVNSQPCIRISGKHNDLDDVGKDNTHLTSFEMLGNWSFGDYYKQESICWAWEFLTKVLEISQRKLLVSVFKSDQESYDLWLKHTSITKSQLVFRGEKDNFWEMGDTGPCGPCSEIHICLSEDIIGTVNPDLDHPKIVELWNLVFIQFNKTERKILKSLDQHHIDTGAGLERLCSYLMNVPSPYRTDLFLPIIKKIESLSGIRYSDEKEGLSHRILSDHIRTLVLGIADNVIPNNEGRGYVLRRLIRRSIRYASKLSKKTHVLSQLVDPVLEVWGEHFSYLYQRSKTIKSILDDEEEKFRMTLDAGVKHFQNIVENLNKSSNSTKLSGKNIFKLYDTYGFPLDLTEILAEEQGLHLDKEEFLSELAIQKNRSRSSTKKLQKKKTNNFIANYINPEDYKNMPLHLSPYQDNIPRGGESHPYQEPEKKLAMAKHHSATHLLHHALRSVLGNHVEQSGSFVDIDKLRFDFTHQKKLTATEISKVDSIVNKFIQDSIPVTTETMSLNEAKEHQVIALFGENYDPDNVRVVKIGPSKELCGGTHITNTCCIEKFVITNETSVSSGIRRIEAITGLENCHHYYNKERQVLINNYQKVYSKLKNLSCNIQDHYNSFLSIPVNLSNCSIKVIQKQLSLLKELSLKRSKRLENLEKNESEILVKSLQSDIIKHDNVNLLCVKLKEAISVTLGKHLIDTLTNQDPTMLAILACVNNDNQNGTLLIKVGKKALQKGFSASSINRYFCKKMHGKGGGNHQFSQSGGCLLNHFLEVSQAFIQLIRSNDTATFSS